MQKQKLQLAQQRFMTLRKNSVNKRRTIQIGLGAFAKRNNLRGKNLIVVS